MSMPTRPNIRFGLKTAGVCRNCNHPHNAHPMARATHASPLPCEFLPCICAEFVPDSPECCAECGHNLDAHKDPSFCGSGPRLCECGGFVNSGEPAPRAKPGSLAWAENTKSAYCERSLTVFDEHLISYHPSVLEAATEVGLVENGAYTFIAAPSTNMDEVIEKINADPRFVHDPKLEAQNDY